MAPFKLIRHNYISVDDAHTHTDLIRCNPLFNNHPRWDCVMLKGDGESLEPQFARLRFVFRVEACGRSWELARVTRMRTLSWPNDSVTGQLLVEEAKSGDFIQVDSIIRHVFFQPAPESLQFYLCDMTDSNLFLRIENQFYL